MKHLLLKAGLVAGALAAVAAPVLASSGPASAAVLSSQVRHFDPRIADGSVELGSPLQNAQFFVRQHGPGHGFISYTNWGYGEAGSGVWAPVAKPDALTFLFQGTPYAHTLNGAGLTLTGVSPTHLRFTGTGQYPASGPAQDAWNITGDVRGSHVSFTITYVTGNPGYVVNGTGTVASDGSATGTAVSNTSPAQNLTWTLPAGTFQSVLHYVAPVQDARVRPGLRNAEFDFVIPLSVPGLGGTEVTVFVHGSPSVSGDVWKHGVGPLTSFPGGAGLTQYPVDAGFIAVV
jgi:hypothetical protein